MKTGILAAFALTTAAPMAAASTAVRKMPSTAADQRVELAQLLAGVEVAAVDDQLDAVVLACCSPLEASVLLKSSAMLLMRKPKVRSRPRDVLDLLVGRPALRRPRSPCRTGRAAQSSGCGARRSAPLRRTGRRARRPRPRGAVAPNRSSCRREYSFSCRLLG
jgi:hypothetical protein